MLMIIRYAFYRLRKVAKKAGTAETARGMSAIDVFTLAPIFFYSFSLSIAICIIFKTEMNAIYWLSMGVIWISAMVYLRKVEKKVNKEFQNMSKLKKWVLSILAFLYYALSVVLLAYTMNYFDTNIRGNI
jgi:hypothetical protein